MRKYKIAAVISIIINVFIIWIGIYFWRRIPDVQQDYLATRMTYFTFIIWIIELCAFCLSVHLVRKANKEEI